MLETEWHRLKNLTMAQELSHLVFLHEVAAGSQLLTLYHALHVREILVVDRFPRAARILHEWLLVGNCGRLCTIRLLLLKG